MGQTVIINLGMLKEVVAVVIWSEKGLAGLRFSQPIDPVLAKRRTKPPHVQQEWGYDP